MADNIITMAPAPRLVRAALAHCEIPLDYTDEGKVNIPAGAGWDSNGMMTIPEGSEIAKLLSAVLTVAMVKHMEDTMVLPSNLSRLREVYGFLDSLANARTITDVFGSLHECKQQAMEAAEIMERVLENLDPANR